MLPFDAPLILALPSPISTNALFSNAGGRGRRRTKEYNAWRKSAAKMLSLQTWAPIVGPCAITLYVGEKGVGGMDVDNTAKAMLDALVKAKIIADDNRTHLRRCSIAWTPKMRGTLAHIRPAPKNPEINEILKRVEGTTRRLVEVYL